MQHRRRGAPMAPSPIRACFGLGKKIIGTGKMFVKTKALSENAV
jgi:hypothetical protein